MQRASRFCVLVVGTLIVFPLSGVSAIQASDEVWKSLEQGGKVVLMRHAPVSRGKGLLRDASCNNEQMLSEKGKQAARRIGEQFRQRNVQIAAVYHSPYCRTADTARIAFGDGTPVDYLYLLEALGQDDATRRTEQLNEVIGSFAGPGNLVLITHEPNIRAISFEQLKQGEFIVLHPRGGSEFDELGVYRQ